MKKLLIFTSDYPYITGDGSFLINEIDDLSKSFDKIYIARKKKLDNVEEHNLPENVELVFQGFKSRKEYFLKGVFNFSKVPFSLFFQDIKEITSLKFLFRFLSSFLFGRAIASDSTIKSLLKQGVVLYSFWGTGMSYAIPFIFKGIHTVIKLHRGDLYDYITGYIPFRRSIYKRANKIITISEDGKSYALRFLKANNIDLDKLEVIRLGTKFHQKEILLNTFDEKVIVSCSSLTSIKRVDLIYKLLSKVSESIKLRWIHFGDGIEKQQLLTLINNENSQLTIDLKGFVSNNKIIDFYRSNNIDFFINLSISEGVPVSIMEAISFNIPVLATDAGGTKEIVGEKHKTGVLIPVEFNFDNTVVLVKKLLQNDENYAPASYWEKYYNSKTNNQKLIQLLRSK